MDSQQGKMTLQAPVQANGVGTVIFSQIPLGLHRVVSQIAVTNDGTLTCTCQILFNNQLVTASVSGNSDTAGGDPAIDVTSADTLKVQWSGATVGSTCIATFYYDEERTGAV